MFAAKDLLLTGTQPITPITFDTAGAGMHAPTSTTFSFSHTIGANANAVVLGFTAGLSSTTAATFTAKVGSTTMTQLDSYRFLLSSYECYMVLYGLLSPPTGAQTISGTSSISALMTGCSVSYNNVAGFGTVVRGVSTTSSAVSLAVSSALNKMVFACFSNAETTAGSFSSFNHTTRFTGATATGPSTVVGLVGDSPGAATVTFTATSNENDWAGLGLPLL